MNIYEKLGVKQYINAAATLTTYGGSIMPDEVVAAMTEASGSYVEILELHRKAGDYIAKLTNNEAAFVSNGAAAGIALATAAVVTGDDPQKREMLPFSEGKNEIVISLAGRARYDFAIKTGGGKRVYYGDETRSTEAELEAAITDDNAAIFMFFYQNRMENQPAFDTQVRIAKKYGVPLFIDAAAQLPLKENLWRLTQDGADLAIFSGGKGLKGPQSSGLVVGKRNLIDRILTIASPNPGFGRPFKVGKEEIVGLAEAVRLYMETDENAVLAEIERQITYVIVSFNGFKGVDLTRSFPGEAGKPMPRVQVKLLPGYFTSSASGISEQLKICRPAVLVLTGEDSLYINSQTLLKDEIKIVVDKIKEVLTENRSGI